MMGSDPEESPKNGCVDQSIWKGPDEVCDWRSFDNPTPNEALWPVDEGGFDSSPLELPEAEPAEILGGAKAVYFEDAVSTPEGAIEWTADIISQRLNNTAHIEHLEPQWRKGQHALAPHHLAFLEWYPVAYRDPFKYGTRLVELTKEIENIDERGFAFDSLQHMTEMALRNNDPLPDAVRAWAADFIGGKVKRPSKSGRKEDVTKGLFITELVDILVTFDGSPWIVYPNEGYRGDEPVTACSILAAALKKNGIGPTDSSGVKNIYYKYKDLLQGGRK